MNRARVESAPAPWADALRTTKRELLLSAARDEFADKGLQRASMRSIAARAGCTTGALYPLFRSKEALYSALLEQSLADLDEAVRAAVEQAPAGREALTAGCRAFVRYYRKHQFEVNLGLYAFQGVRRQGVGKQSDRVLNEALLRVLGRLTTPLEELLGPSDQPASSLVALLFSQMIGALVLDMAGRLEVLGTDAVQLVDQLLVHLVPAPPRP